MQTTKTAVKTWALKEREDSNKSWSVSRRLTTELANGFNVHIPELQSHEHTAWKLIPDLILKLRTAVTNCSIVTISYIRF